MPGILLFDLIEFHHVGLVAVIILISHWLYWKYTGLYYSRSLVKN